MYVGRITPVLYDGVLVCCAAHRQAEPSQLAMRGYCFDWINREVDTELEQRKKSEQRKTLAPPIPYFDRLRLRLLRDPAD
ncbi:hypothetical protein RvY_16459 [Ramazzottius varieornatus]|uniref:Uncharacterized protein n=1 Tax=Ramazzottius varieornatus TaxID=947166 RepID=A0A1D1VYJ5_RAMVA|nr:hypothetical protein RvY_16459 [Ramazzottius varieornatus]